MADASTSTELKTQSISSVSPECYACVAPGSFVVRCVGDRAAWTGRLGRRVVVFGPDRAAAYHLRLSIPQTVRRCKARPVDHDAGPSLRCDERSFDCTFVFCCFFAGMIELRRICCQAVGCPLMIPRCSLVLIRRPGLDSTKNPSVPLEQRRCNCAFALFCCSWFVALCVQLYCCANVCSRPPLYQLRGNACDSPAKAFSVDITVCTKQFSTFHMQTKAGHCHAQPSSK